MFSTAVCWTRSLTYIRCTIQTNHPWNKLTVLFRFALLVCFQSFVHSHDAFTHILCDCFNVPSRKSYNALDKYPTTHNSITEMRAHVHISVTKWCNVGWGTDALLDLWDGSIAWLHLRKCNITMNEMDDANHIKTRRNIIVYIFLGLYRMI